jgi:stage III sporulation protein AG
LKSLGVNKMANLWELDFKTMFRKFGDNPVSIWFLLGIIGLGLIFLVGGDHQENPAKRTPLPITNHARSDQTGSRGPAPEIKLEQEMTRILSRIAGAGVVQVDISLKTARRNLWERQSRVSKRVSQQKEELDTEESSSDELVFAKNREGTDTPILKAELAPEVQGVLVVATGARESGVKRLLTETIMTVLDLPAHRVMVIAGKDESR